MKIIITLKSGAQIEQKCAKVSWKRSVVTGELESLDLEDISSKDMLRYINIAEIVAIQRQD